MRDKVVQQQLVVVFAVLSGGKCRSVVKNTSQNIHSSPTLFLDTFSFTDSTSWIASIGRVFDAT